MLVLLPPAQAPAPATVTLTQRFSAGTPAEAAALAPETTSTIRDGARVAEPGQSWTYQFVLPRGARVTMRYSGDGAPEVTVARPDGKPNAAAHSSEGAVRLVRTTAPADLPVGGALRFTFRSVDGIVSVREVVLSAQLPDANGDGMPDAIAGWMGVPKGGSPTMAPRPALPHTSFQTGERFDPGIGVHTDAVLVYSSDPQVYAGWADKGYVLQTMGGFREGPEYLKQFPDEVQRDGNGNPIVIGGSSYYMLPTPHRNDVSKQYYQAAIAAGSTAICPEEPEIMTSAGYEEPFKQEWQVRYGSAWQPPHSSIDARYHAEQLKGFLTARQIGAILDDARDKAPNVTRMVAVHSPITYYHWGIPVPHAALFGLASLQEVIAQVWTGTARTAARAAGVREERTFEIGYLEYSSLLQLARGTGKRLWFLMDPVEDNPDRPMEDYRVNYEQTLLAALMFPQVDRYEVMPWPQRIYGRVPPEYATVVNTVVGTLSDLWQYTDSAVDAGSEGIGTFVADSMGWQRGAPAPSDMDGFYGLCLPLVLHGIPAQVLSLDRLATPGYLTGQKTLLLSYDHLKPAAPDANKALADWVRRGGSLVVFGGTDAYDAVADSWWRKAGLVSPLDDLFAQLGLATKRGPAPQYPEPVTKWTELLRGDGAEHSLTNRKRYTMDLSRISAQTGSVAVRFRDASEQDGWGPYVTTIELRIDGKIAAAFSAGSDLETRFLVDDTGSQISGPARFADGTNYWIYRFDNLPKDKPVTLTVDMGNGFLVEAGPAPAPPISIEAAFADPAPRLAKLRLQRKYPLTSYSLPDGATPLYKLAGATPLVWEAKSGAGTVTYVGIAPGYVTATDQTSRWLRWLVKRAYQAAGGTYKESGSFVAKRGPFVGVRALAQEESLDGRYVDLLDSSLPVVEDPTVAPRGRGLYMKAGSTKGAPRVIAVSGRLRARTEQTGATGFFVQAPSRTQGAARLFAGGKSVASAAGFTAWGQPIAVKTSANGSTVLVRYPNDVDGVAVRITWK